MAPNSQTLISKKFIYAITLSILGFVFVLIGKTPASEWFSFVQVIGGMYVIGNIADKVVNKPADTTAVKAPAKLG